MFFLSPIRLLDLLSTTNTFHSWCIDAGYNYSVLMYSAAQHSIAQLNWQTAQCRALDSGKRLDSFSNIYENNNRFKNRDDKISIFGLPFAHSFAHERLRAKNFNLLFDTVFDKSFQSPQSKYDRTCSETQNLFTVQCHWHDAWRLKTAFGFWTSERSVAFNLFDLNWLSFSDCGPSHRAVHAQKLLFSRRWHDAWYLFYKKQ